MDIQALIQDYLTKTQIMHLATTHGNKPWVTALYFAVDINLSIYWLSRRSRRHSREIEKNSHVAGTIVIPHSYGDKVRGLQFEGEARVLHDQDAVAGKGVYSSKFWVVEDRASNDVEGEDNQGCYQIKPERFILYDEVNFPNSPSQELKL